MATKTTKRVLRLSFFSSDGKAKTIQITRAAEGSYDKDALKSFADGLVDLSNEGIFNENQVTLYAQARSVETVMTQIDTQVEYDVG
jgi:hypothetical protein